MYVKFCTLAVVLLWLEPLVVQMWFKDKQNIPNNTKLSGNNILLNWLK